VGNPFQITDLSIGTTYYFVLSAKNNEKTSLQTREIAHKVQSPDDRVSISFPAETTSITLAWDPTEEASAYNLYWRSTKGVTRQNGIKISNVNTPHKLPGLIPGVSYYFVVTALGKNGGESSESEEISYQNKK
jgi:fibronectin type 3 domain-containing protein